MITAPQDKKVASYAQQMSQWGIWVTYGAVGGTPAGAKFMLCKESKESPTQCFLKTSMAANGVAGWFVLKGDLKEKILAQSADPIVWTYGLGAVQNLAVDPNYSDALSAESLLVSTLLAILSPM